MKPNDKQKLERIREVRTTGEEVSSREGTMENIKILGFKVLILELKFYLENITWVVGKPWSFRSWF